MMLMAVTGFRGFTAPASLEHVAQDVCDHVQPWFPGLYRPGLIGAPRPRRRRGSQPAVSGALPPRPHWSSPTPSWRATSPRFRGFTAPASLEPHPGRWGAPLAHDGFRGFTAPASLERGCCRLQRCRPSAVSGALPPRPHWSEPRRQIHGHREHRFPGLYRPGLIGAGLSPGTRTANHLGFRGFTAPASLEP